MDITTLPQGKANQSLPKALIIENSPQETEFFKKNLQKIGYQTVCALTGEEGLRLAMSENPHVVLLGVLFPGINGWDVLMRLKLHPNTATIPVIIVSTVDEKEKAETLGAAAAVSNSIDEKQLFNLLNKVLHIKTPQTILLVDDDNLSRVFIKNRICPSRCQVVEVENGLAALEILDKMTPDLILLDLLMPMMDGFEFLEHLPAKNARNVPVIVISSKTLTNEDCKKMDTEVLKIINKNDMDIKKEAQYLTRILENNKNNKTANPNASKKTHKTDNR
jgi:CheY-like chemotaxis protein